ncbi:MAG TPA: hypothetical protein VKY24_02465 [Reyranella sp.]|jgi:hypothetical protein|nr:hypothetical protein [Reyranella sp.]
MMRGTLVLLVLAGALAQGGCAVSCGATPERLASLRRGMSYDETAAVMGCPGGLVTDRSPLTGEFAIVEWSGPASRVFSWTQIDFLDGKLLSYSTGRRGAL